MACGEDHLTAGNGRLPAPAYSDEFATVYLGDCLEVVAKLREHGVEAPLVLMGYMNPFLKYGLERLFAAAPSLTCHVIVRGAALGFSLVLLYLIARSAA